MGELQNRRSFSEKSGAKKPALFLDGAVQCDTRGDLLATNAISASHNFPTMHAGRHLSASNTQIVGTVQAVSMDHRGEQQITTYINTVAHFGSKYDHNSLFWKE